MWSGEKRRYFKEKFGRQLFFLGPTDPRVGSAIASNIWSIYHKVIINKLKNKIFTLQSRLESYYRTKSRVLNLDNEELISLNQCLGSGS